ncbi:MAG: NUDIX hydrolase [Pirellulaceae bacterium]
MQPSSDNRFCYEYPRPAVSVDMVVLHQPAGKPAHVLLIERKNDPYSGCWALPGGFLDLNETLEEAAARELHEETHLTCDLIKPIGAFSRVDRDPRGRVISFAFLSVVDSSHAETVQAGDDAEKVKWFPIDKLPELAFDHEDILNAGIEHFRESFL